MGINRGSRVTPDGKRWKLSQTQPKQGHFKGEPTWKSSSDDLDFIDQDSPNLAIILSAQIFAASNLAVSKAQKELVSADWLLLCSVLESVSEGFDAAAIAVLFACDAPAAIAASGGKSSGMSSEDTA